MSPLAVSKSELLAVLLIAAGFLIPQGYFVFRLDRYVRRKGYQSPFRAAFFLCAFGLIVVAGFMADARDPRSCWSCTPAANPEFFQRALIRSHLERLAFNLGLTTTAATLVVAFVAWLVPPHARRSGPRHARFPWQAVGVVSLAGIPASVILGVTGATTWANVFRISMISYMLYAGCVSLAKRLHSKPIEQVLQEDPRPSVLYLRPFEREDDYFTAPLNDECRALGIPIRNPSAFRQTATLEEYFFREVTARLGPFVGLGDPYDYAPPAGVARVYLPDEGWEAEFLSMARNCGCIFLALGESPNFERELRSLRDERLLTKVFAFTSPPPKDRWYARQWGRSVKKQWIRFARELSACDFEPGEYPGDGAVVGFEPSGRVIVLAVSCRTPKEYVAAVESHLPVDDAVRS